MSDMRELAAAIVLSLESVLVDRTRQRPAASRHELEDVVERLANMHEAAIVLMGRRNPELLRGAVSPLEVALDVVRLRLDEVESVDPELAIVFRFAHAAITEDLAKIQRWLGAAPDQD